MSGRGNGQSHFRKSRFSGVVGCIEVAMMDDGERVLIRDSKNRDELCLCFNGEEWRAFVSGVTAGEFDL